MRLATDNSRRLIITSENTFFWVSAMIIRAIIRFFLVVFWTMVGGSGLFMRCEARQDDELAESLQNVVRAGFMKVHQGFSSDEVLLQDELQQAFLAYCRQRMPDVEAWRFNWTLLNLRKAGKLSDVPTTQFRRERVEDCGIVAEIAARYVQDKFDMTIDRILADPDLRGEFDRAARDIDPRIDLYRTRKAAFQLRKARKLQPELVTRIATWGREVQVFPLDTITTNIQIVPARAGIYIFRDASGYLYIGEADNLQRRLQQHIAKSDRISLLDYLQQQGSQNITVEIHTFEEGSPIERLSVRRAYESELIRSRNPRFNMRP